MNTNHVYCIVGLSFFNFCWAENEYSNIDNLTLLIIKNTFVYNLFLKMHAQPQGMVEMNQIYWCINGA